MRPTGSDALVLHFPGWFTGDGCSGTLRVSEGEAAAARAGGSLFGDVAGGGGLDSRGRRCHSQR